jgi:SAM-dependent methyltransferase
MRSTLVALAKGIATFVPGLDRYLSIGSGGTDSARYCYSIWLRHMVLASRNGLDANPTVIAELGPGDSLGIGISALLAGAEKYYALDVVRHADVRRNLAIFDQLVSLFRNRQDIPGHDEFPNARPALEDYRFPAQLLTDARLQASLATARLERIRASIENPQAGASMISYMVPWYDPSVLRRESVDVIYSQAVLEHVDDLRNTYQSMHSWLKPNGYLSHQIDFKSHGTAETWNGHWGHSDLMWGLIRGRRPYLLNREPYSTHVRMLEANGFRVLFEKKVNAASGLSRQQLAARFQALSDDDLATSSAFVQAAKR